MLFHGLQVTAQGAHTGAVASVTAAFMDSYRRKDESKGYRCFPPLAGLEIARGGMCSISMVRGDCSGSVRGRPWSRYGHSDSCRQRTVCYCT